MNDKFKNYFWVAATVALLAGSYGVISYVKSYAKSIQPSSFRSFAVSGEGKAVSAPDVAEFSFSVISEGGKNVAELQKQNTEKVNKAIDYVKSQKVEAKDIKTVGYSVEPRYQYFSCYGGDGGKPCPPPEIVGYSVSQTVTVKARDFSKVGDILTGVVQNGANSVSSLNFTMDDPTAAENQAREEAIRKAKEKAKDVAKAGGFRLGRLISIEEGYSGGVPIYSRLETLSKGVGGGNDTVSLPAPAIEPGSQETMINVTLRYEIE